MAKKRKAKKATRPKIKRTAATLTLNKPGAYSARGRKAIADWLRAQAHHLIHHGKDYTEKGNFRARFHFT